MPLLGTRDSNHSLASEFWRAMLQGAATMERHLEPSMVPNPPGPGARWVSSTFSGNDVVPRAKAKADARVSWAGRR